MQVASGQSLGAHPGPLRSQGTERKAVSACAGICHRRANGLSGRHERMRPPKPRSRSWQQRNFAVQGYRYGGAVTNVDGTMADPETVSGLLPGALPTVG